jgi:hypothetical protein
MKHKCKSIQAIDKLKVLQPQFTRVLIVIHATMPKTYNSQKSTPDPQKKVAEDERRIDVNDQNTANQEFFSDEGRQLHESKVLAQENEN